VDRLAGALRVRHPELPHWAATAGARAALAEARAEDHEGSLAALEDEAAARARALARPRPVRVVNATGVVLHTNLGRALLAPEAAAAAASAATCYGDLELDLATGRRGDRQETLARKLALLAGTEAALAVNNNAAALLLAVTALGRGREVVVSRGELVEIGGSFRLPEILAAAEVRLVEVGTTNRTHAEDYRRAIGPETAVLLKVHRSNFEQRGFVAEVDVPTLAAIARERRPEGARGLRGEHSSRLTLIEDLGSATLVDLRGSPLGHRAGSPAGGPTGLPESSYAPARVRLGADVVCFSGDKLFGGPQAGILIGRAEPIAAMRSHPLARAVRLDKMALAALDWTATALLAGELDRIPTLAALLEPEAAVERRARELARRLAAVAVGARAPRVDVQESRAPVGGGSLPGFELASWAVVLSCAAESGPRAETLAARLRAAPVPVVARVAGDAVLLDARTLREHEIADVEAALRTALDGGAGGPR
jgi:L-seryl-tRNA(Ser) seleniumtransferase